MKKVVAGWGDQGHFALFHRGKPHGQAIFRPSVIGFIEIATISENLELQIDETWSWKVPTW